jgi:hypothetical protein
VSRVTDDSAAQIGRLVPGLLLAYLERDMQQVAVILYEMRRLDPKGEVAPAIVAKLATSVIRGVCDEVGIDPGDALRGAAVAATLSENDEES